MSEWARSEIQFSLEESHMMVRQSYYTKTNQSVNNGSKTGIGTDDDRGM
jgi:hypothetical protein